MIGNIVLVAVSLAIALLFFAAAPVPIHGSALIAVVNDTTNRIVWVGSGAVAIPYCPNTHMVFRCVRVGSTSYRCNGTVYESSANQIQMGCGISNNSG